MPHLNIRVKLYVWAYVIFPVVSFIIYFQGIPISEIFRTLLFVWLFVAVIVVFEKFYCPKCKTPIYVIFPVLHPTKICKKCGYDLQHDKDEYGIRYENGKRISI